MCVLGQSTGRARGTLSILLHNEFLTGHRQDANLMCSFSHWLCVVFPVITSIMIQSYNVNCEQGVEKETIFYVVP